MRRHTLNFIRALTGNQWSCRNIVVTSSRFFFRRTRRAALFWTICNHFNEQSGNPTRRLFRLSSFEEMNADESWSHILGDIRSYMADISEMMITGSCDVIDVGFHVKMLIYDSTNVFALFEDWIVEFPITGFEMIRKLSLRTCCDGLSTPENIHVQ